MKTLLFVLLIVQSFLSYSQEIDELKNEINELLADKEATVGVAILGENPQDTLSINGNVQLPMQSVYKYHLGAAVLHEVDKGTISLTDSMEITPADLDNELWSMIRRKYPEGAKLPISEVLKYTIANSDNVGCDMLFDLIGGPEKVDTYMHESGISDIAVKHKEITIQSDWELQYQNWTTACAGVLALRTFYENKEGQLSEESHAYLWDVMKTSWSGKISMRTYLPEKIVLAHKTGHSGKNEDGLTAAQNEMGIIFLPCGEPVYLSVFVSNSMEEKEVNKQLIADITKLTYNHFVSRKKK